MANFSPGAMLKIGPGKFVGKRFTFTTQAVRMPKFIFQPRLKFECDYMRFFSPFDRLTLHVIATVFLRRFVQEAEPG